MLLNNQVLSQYFKRVIYFAVVVFSASLLYFIYVSVRYPRLPEQETVLTEIGEVFGNLGLFLLAFIYARTLLKLLLGKGRLAQRLLPDYRPHLTLPPLNAILALLNKTHVYLGITTIAVLLLHIALMGIPMHILFFPAVVILLIWQGLFGLFLNWRFTPQQLKKLSYLVHAQFVTGIMLGIFAGFGHLLIDD